MKKFLVLLSVACIAIGISAQDLKLSTGLGFGAELRDNTNNFSTSGLAVEIKTMTNKDSGYLNFGAYFDAIFALLTVDYAIQFSNTHITTTITLPVSTNTSFDTSILSHNLELGLVAKLPLQILKGFILFPMAGAEYDVNLLYTNKDTLPSAQQLDLNALYLIAGLGNDIYFTDNLYFRAMLKAGLQMTATPTVPADFTAYSGFKLEANVALGLAF